MAKDASIYRPRLRWADRGKPAHLPVTLKEMLGKTSYSQGRETGGQLGDPKEELRAIRTARRAGGGPVA